MPRRVLNHPKEEGGSLIQQVDCRRSRVELSKLLPLGVKPGHLIVEGMKQRPELRSENGYPIGLDFLSRTMRCHTSPHE